MNDAQHNLASGRFAARKIVGKYRHFAASIDNNIIGSQHGWPQRLDRLVAEGWIDRSTASVTLTELARAGDEAPRLLDDVTGTIILGSPHVEGHTPRPYSVHRSDADRERFLRVFAVVFPGRDPDADEASEGRGRRCFRDALHVSVAVRSGMDAFVTLDRDIFRRAADIQAEFGLVVYRPRQCVMKVAGYVAQVRRVARPEDLARLPRWPSAELIASWATEGEGPVGQVIGVGD